jgi:hypothetical protein
MTTISALNIVADCCFRLTPHGKGLAAEMDAANPRDRARLQDDYDAARQAHGDGVVDWHNVVLYIVCNRAFLYDPSALSIGATSESGKEALRQVEEDEEQRHRRQDAGQRKHGGAAVGLGLRAQGPSGGAPSRITGSHLTW